MSSILTQLWRFSMPVQSQNANWQNGLRVTSDCKTALLTFIARPGLLRSSSRARRACLGKLVQIDGCEHRWFEERAPACTTLVFVDDATSRLMAVRFALTESTFGYFEATREYIENHGKPLAFYSDKASIFRINRAAAATGPGHTQFARALYELNIEGICANTPAAKGRVERAHLTLQDRLVKELRLEGISSIAAANAFMPSFIAAYNKKFARAPLEQHDAHRPLRADEDMDFIFCWRELRKVTKALTLHYERKLYMIADNPANRRFIGKYLEVFQYPDGRIEIRVAGKALPYSGYDKLGQVDPVAVVDNKRLGHILEVAKLVQAKRDSRAVDVPSTAHRADGTIVPRTRVVDSKRQRDLSPEDLREALARSQRRASDAQRAPDRISKRFGKISKRQKEVQADIST